MAKPDMNQFDVATETREHDGYEAQRETARLVRRHNELNGFYSQRLDELENIITSLVDATMGDQPSSIAQ